MMLVVVPVKEFLPKGTRILDASEAVRELGPVLEGFEQALRVRVVIRNVGSTMGFGYT